MDLAGLRRRAVGAFARVPRRELLWLAGAILAGLVLRLAYVYVSRGHVLAGDEPDYDAMGRLADEGRWFWSTSPYGEPHPSAWKAPLYPTWVGVWYELLGPRYNRVLAVQALVGPATIALTWVLARRLTTPTAAIAAAWVVALHPNVWQFELRLYPDGLATLATVAVLVAFLGREPTARRAALVGALAGVAMLIRPSAMLLLAGIAVAWWIALGARRGTARLAVTLAVAALVIAPWAIRNAVVMDAFIPFSIQDAAVAGTFNDTAADDPVWPYKWRIAVERDLDLEAAPRSEPELRRVMVARAFDYIAEHPDAVPKAFFWNGITRLWDVRRPSHVMAEAPFEGRDRGVALAGLIVYWALLPLALAGLWRHRHRRELVLPVLAMALAASVVFTSVSGTRYRATLEPLVVVMACAAFVAPGRAREGIRAAAPNSGPMASPSSIGA